MAGLLPCLHPCTRPRTTALCTATPGCVRTNCSQRMAKVFDQYLSFIALEGKLFSLGLRDTYLQLNDPKAQDMQVQVRKGAYHLCSSHARHSRASPAQEQPCRAAGGAHARMRQRQQGRTTERGQCGL